jgi:AraC family transcriptional regulator, regulatory protein of adaptative response / DNA-3-methyladenine glycosylase II
MLAVGGPGYVRRMSQLPVRRRIHEFTADLAVQRPFAAAELLGFLSHRAIAGVESVDATGYARTVRLAGGPGTIRLRMNDLADAPDRATPGAPVTATIRLTDPDDLDEALALSHRLVDAAAAPAIIDATLAADPALADLVAACPGIRLPGTVDGAEIVFRAMFGQQVSVAAARTTLLRLTVRLGEPLPFADCGLTHLFPDPGAVAWLGADGIAGPRKRATAIVGVAAAISSGELDPSHGRSSAELIADLVARPGIGPWTAGYVAMRLLGDRDVLLTGDLALRQGAAARDIPAGVPALAEYGRRWRPFRSYAGLHLWRAVPQRSRTATRR